MAKRSIDLFGDIWDSPTRDDQSPKTNRPKPQLPSAAPRPVSPGTPTNEARHEVKQRKNVVQQSPTHVRVSKGSEHTKGQTIPDSSGPSTPSLPRQPSLASTTPARSASIASRAATAPARAQSDVSTIHADGAKGFMADTTILLADGFSDISVSRGRVFRGSIATNGGRILNSSVLSQLSIAEVQRLLVDPKLTHVVTGAATTDDFRNRFGLAGTELAAMLRRPSRTECHVVVPDWLSACLKAGNIVDCRRYESPLVTVSCEDYQPETFGDEYEGADAATTISEHTEGLTGGFIDVFFGSLAAPATKNDPDMDRRKATGTKRERSEEPGEMRRAPEWRDSESKEVESPFVSERQQRKNAYVDRVRPFACQRGGTLAPKEEPAAEDNVQPAEQGTNQEVNKGGSSDTIHPNNVMIISELQRLHKIYESSGDHWRKYAYSRAIAALRRVRKPILTPDDVRSIPGVGDKIALKVGEILTTGTSRKADHLESSDEMKALRELGGIWGVGPATAKQLFQSGATSVEQLRKQPAIVERLNPPQKIGLKHYEDLQQRIPRSEVQLIERIVKDSLARLGNPNLHAEACGSYRRGKPDSGDVDILICDLTGGVQDGILGRLVDDLFATGLLTDELTYSLKSQKKSEVDTWMGICRVPSCNMNVVGAKPEVKEEGGIDKPVLSSACPCLHRQSFDSDPDQKLIKAEHPSSQVPLDACWAPEDSRPASQHLFRRLDIKVYSAEHYPFAILYFTGSDYFNRSMRLYCEKKGFTLSDKSLRPAVRTQAGRVHDGNPILCATERDIFAAIGLPYKEPHERNV